MPSAYECRHVELDNVGRGKRVIQPPGGVSSDIFGRNSSPSFASDGSVASNLSSPTSSNPGSRRGSLRGNADTQNRLFGASDESPRHAKKSVQRPSFVLGDGELLIPASPKKSREVIQAALNGQSNGEVKINDLSNGNNGSPASSSANGSLAGSGRATPLSMPGTPSRVRQPPGGKTAVLW